MNLPVGLRHLIIGVVVLFFSAISAITCLWSYEHNKIADERISKMEQLCSQFKIGSALDFLNLRNSIQLMNLPFEIEIRDTTGREFTDASPIKNGSVRISSVFGNGSTTQCQITVKDGLIASAERK
jgi:hypothetical protein